MPSRRSRQPATPAAASQAEPQLPAYQAPSAPLNTQGQQALQRLQNQGNQKLLQHFKDASVELSQSVYTLNSAYANQEDFINSRKEKFGEDDPRYKSKIPSLQALGDKVETMNPMLESKVREVIDAQIRQEMRQNALKEISTNATRSNGRPLVPATQSTLGASQFRSGRTQGDDEDMDEDGNPVAPDAGPGMMDTLKQKLDENDQEYSQLSLAQRYAEHNDYITFRKSLHDGRYEPLEESRPVMPHASTWFDADGPVFHAGSQNEASTQDNGNGDSDVEAVAENINIKCPITLLPMEDPVKSSKCPHTFEKSAIMEMLRHSTTRVSGRGRFGQHTVECPVCDEIISENDLVPDPDLRRQIERILAKQARNNNRMDDDDDDDDAFESSGRPRIRAQTVDSSQLEPLMPTPTQIKSEKASGISRRSLVPTGGRPDHEHGRMMRPPISTREVVDMDMDVEDNEEQE